MTWNTPRHPILKYEKYTILIKYPNRFENYINTRYRKIKHEIVKKFQFCFKEKNYLNKILVNLFYTFQHFIFSY